MSSFQSRSAVAIATRFERRCTASQSTDLSLLVASKRRLAELFEGQRAVISRPVTHQVNGLLTVRYRCQNEARLTPRSFGIVVSPPRHQMRSVSFHLSQSASFLSSLASNCRAVILFVNTLFVLNEAQMRNVIYVALPQSLLRLRHAKGRHFSS